METGTEAGKREAALKAQLDLVLQDRQRAVRRAEEAEAVVESQTQRIRRLELALRVHATRMALTEAGAAA